MFSIDDYSDVVANQLNERRTALGGRENGNFGGGKEKEHKRPYRKKERDHNKWDSVINDDRPAGQITSAKTRPRRTRGVGRGEDEISGNIVAERMDNGHVTVCFHGPFFDK